MAVRATQAATLAAAGSVAADVRVTQAVVLAAYQAPAEGVRATHGAVLALVRADAEPVRATHAVVLAAVERQSLRVTQAHVLVAAAALRPPCLSASCWLWRIERRDGTIYRFTSHDRPVTYFGATYEPCESLSASAIDVSSRLDEAGDLALAGIVSATGISEADLFAGEFDGAAVRVYLHTWDTSRDSTPTTLVAQGQMGKLRQRDTAWEADVLTPVQKLQQGALLQVYTPSCRWVLGDSRCGVSLASLQVSGSVTAIAAPDLLTGAQRRVFVDSARAEASGYWTHGLLTWTSGLNAGQVVDVKEATSGGVITLWTPAAAGIAVGDTYTITPGCDKTLATCKAKYNNVTRFGGFPHVPGRDRLYRTPDAKE